MPGTHPPNILVGGGRQREYPPILLRTFGYSRPTFVALRLLSLKPISSGYKTPPIRFSQAGGQSAHKARPPNLELALTPQRTPRPVFISSILFYFTLDVRKAIAQCESDLTRWLLSLSLSLSVCVCAWLRSLNIEAN